MNKAILAILGSLVFFIVGLTATYFAMPAIAPDLVEQVQLRIDSLSAAEQQMEIVDSLDSLQTPADSVSHTDSLLYASPLNGLRDSIEFLILQLDREKQIKDTLLMRIGSMEKKWMELAAKYDEARQMSNTITKLEDKELSELLSRLNDDVLESMYIEASARNRARLLQMLPADKAAILVNRLTDPSFSLTSDSNPADDPTRQ